MARIMSVIATSTMVLTISSPAISGSCQEKDGMVLCTDDVGRDATLQSWDKALGSPGSYSPPPSYPEALKTFPSDIKSSDGRQKGTRSDIQTDDSAPKTTLEKDKE
jgi:hypothetical protein